MKTRKLQKSNLKAHFFVRMKNLSKIIFLILKQLKFLINFENYFDKIFPHIKSRSI